MTHCGVEQLDMTGEGNDGKPLKRLARVMRRFTAHHVNDATGCANVESLNLSKCRLSFNKKASITA